MAAQVEDVEGRNCLAMGLGKLARYSDALLEKHMI